MSNIWTFPKRIVITVFSTIYSRDSLRCHEFFLLNQRFKVNHGFFVHYGAGRDAFDEKPDNYTNLEERQKNEITFAQHAQDYDFNNSEKLVNDFSLNVKRKIRRLRRVTSLLCAAFLYKTFRLLLPKMKQRL